MKVWIQKWEESERDWGTRPDGFTVHARREDIAAFVKVLREREQKGHSAGWVPDEYSRPCGAPYVADIQDPEFLKRLTAVPHGLWGQGREPPSAIVPGADQTGWVSVPDADERKSFN